MLILKILLLKVSNLGKAAKLVSSLIVQHHWIFSGQEVEEEASADAGPEENSKGPENITVKSADMLAASTHQAMNNSKSPHIKNEPSHTEQTVSFTE